MQLVEKRRKVVTMESALSMAPPSHRRACAPVSVSSHACARRGRAQPPHRRALPKLAGVRILQEVVTMMPAASWGAGAAARAPMCEACVGPPRPPTRRPAARREDRAAAVATGSAPQRRAFF